eukprot:TRINITY_DN5861_c0_g1_i2.p1 TRINITY_DN5861_c0_g1~~TRINITY_DN5861_c0_g1_i2.p1  ORF type:complete len:119 (+),score=13.05 TRINITY_DN5861_c0_g1_i2:144-500(+)
MVCLIMRSPVKPSPRQVREVQSLYRDIIRTAQYFTWEDEKGEPWGPRLVREARKEIESNKYVVDPEAQTRLVIAAREALEKTVDALVEKHQQLAQAEEADLRKQHLASERYKEDYHRE